VKPPKYFYFRVKTGKDKILLEDASDADVVEVVRCKDCKYAEHWYGDKLLCSLWKEQDRVSVFADGFCSYGTVKQEATCTK
jgi:hypothetical protein